MDVAVTLRIQPGRKDIRFGPPVSLKLVGGKDYAGSQALRGERLPRACDSL